MISGRERALLLPAAVLILAAVLGGCAGTRDDDTADAPESADTGWLDFSVRDLDVPPDPFAQLSDGTIRPPSCELTVDLDGRRIHSQTLEPVGANPPYRVEFDFRVPVAPGDYGAAVIYTGCRSHARGLDSVAVELQIEVRRQRITRIRFDGSLLEADYPSRAISESPIR